MQSFEKKAWEQFRAAVIEMDGGRCVRCGRGHGDGVVLQVHHKHYIKARPIWDYPTSLCETLCSGCHAREHGIIRPSVGWDCVGYHDLEDLTGTCDACGTSIRHVFFIQISGWPPLEVGEICCDNFTSTTLATTHMESLRRYESRRRRFIESSRWKLSPTGSSTLSQSGLNLVITGTAEGYVLIANGIPGRQRFASLAATKSATFELIETGSLRDFLVRQGVVPHP